MNKKTFSIRRFEMSDVDEVVQLLNIVFNTQFSPKWWNWKYKFNPAGFWGEQGDIWVAENKDKIVGYYAVIPEKIKFGSETITVAQSVDTATHPDYRRMGIFATLAKKVYAEVQDRYRFLFGFSSEMAYKGFLKLGWKDFPITEFVKVLNYDHILRKNLDNNFLVWSGKTALKMLCAVKYLSSTLLLKRYVGSSAEIRKEDRFPDEIDDFWKQVRSENEVILERTSTFLNWRFSKYFGNYQIYIGRSTQNRSIIGYLVLKKREVDNVLDIVDLYALPDEDKIILKLIDLAIAIGEKKEFDSVHCRIPKWHRYAKIVSRLGFISLNQVFGLLKKYQSRVIFYRFIGKGKIPDIQQWFYTLADTDYA